MIMGIISNFERVCNDKEKEYNEINKGFAKKADDNETKRNENEKLID